MSILIDGSLVPLDDLTIDWLAGGSIPALDGEVRSAAEIVAIANDPANAGKSFYLRNGEYGNVDLDLRARPDSQIHFVTYPGELAIFDRLSFEQSANLDFDGNAVNYFWSTAGQAISDGAAGLWIRGNGGFEEPAGVCVLFNRGGPEWNENIRVANARIGDEASTNPANWRWQHGVWIRTMSRSLTFENLEIAYVGGDSVGGDQDAGGIGIWWQFGSGEQPLTGDHTFQGLHIHHTVNDAVQTGGSPPDGDADAVLLFDTFLFENLGGNHVDFIQQQASMFMTFSNGVFRFGSQFLMVGGAGLTRSFDNCYFGPLGATFNFPGKTDFPPEDNYDFNRCTILAPLRLDSNQGAAASASNTMRNSIYTGWITVGEVPDNCFSNGGEANVAKAGALSGDTTKTVPLDGNYEPTDGTTQGFRVPDDFPWRLS